MNISNFCIERPVFTTLLTLAILAGGIAGYSALPTSALPSVDFPTIQVSADLSGASPETMASAVATPLERQFSTIPGISSMTSTSTLGSTDITLQFDLDRSIDGAALDVQTAIATAVRRLPHQMTTPPGFRKVNPADQPVLFIAVSSDTVPITQVNEYADTLMAQRISMLPGVAQVRIFGAQKYAVRIQVDPHQLAARNISFDDVQVAVANAASNAPVGVISGDRQLFNLEVSGQPFDASGFRPVVVAWRDGAPVRLQDVAKVIDSVENNRSYGAFNGKRAIVLAIQRQPDANTIDVVARVRALLPKFRDQLPASIQMTPTFDRAVSVRRSIDDVQITLMVSIVLVVLVIFLFLRRATATFIPAVAMPLSIVATFGGMALLGFSINNVSLLALTLCVGFVVDDAIVMLENIVRHVEKGMAPYEAALKGSREIGFTIMSMTISLVAVFIPVLFMSGIVGRLFREFAITISLAIIVSGFISLTLSPMLCSRWLRAEDRTREPKWSLALEDGFEWLRDLYHRSLLYVLVHRRATLMLTFGTLIATVLAFTYVPKGFFPLEDAGFIFASTEGAADISFQAMIVKTRAAATVIRSDPAVASVFYSADDAANSGRMFIGLVPRAQRPSVFAVIQGLRKKLAALTGVNVFMQPVQNMQIGGRPAKSLYQYTLQGGDLAKLYAWSEEFRQGLAKQPGFQDVTTDLQLKSLKTVVMVNRDRAASLGVNLADIRQTLYSAFGTQQAASLYTASNDYEVIVEASPDAQLKPEDVKKLYVRSAQGQLVPLDAIATLAETSGPVSVNHQGQIAAVTIAFNLAAGVALSDAVTRINQLQDQLHMPSSIVAGFQGTAQAFQASAQGQGFLILLAVLVIYIVLGMLYESFVHPITIISGLPSAALGAILTLFLFGMDLSVIAIIGLVLLVGIVKKNAIMMVDFALEAQRGGAAPDDAIVQACILRFRPIMMTTMSALLGTLPIAIGFGAGSELRQPLGIVVVGGLLTSQLLTLYITPVVFLYLDGLTARFRRQPAPAVAVPGPRAERPAVPIDRAAE